LAKHFLIYILLYKLCAVRIQWVLTENIIGGEHQDACSCACYIISPTTQHTPAMLWSLRAVAKLLLPVSKWAWTYHYMIIHCSSRADTKLGLSTKVLIASSNFDVLRLGYVFTQKMRIYIGFVFFICRRENKSNYTLRTKRS